MVHFLSEIKRNEVILVHNDKLHKKEGIMQEKP